jgi:LacI family transcriptional regulator
MARPTIKDLADAANVSVSTVNRILRGAGEVRGPTMERVCQVAEEIGFYGLGTIKSAISANRETYRFGILLQQRGRVFYDELGSAIMQAAKTFPDATVAVELEFMRDLLPESTADQIRDMGQRCDAISLVAPEHPTIVDAINEVTSNNVPVIALISPILSNGNVGYVGLDNWKVGRTAAWAFDRLTRRSGKIATFVGHHRFKNQDQNESGFRSYFREHKCDLTLLEAETTFESSSVAHELTEKLIKEHDDLTGVFISGGGITGVLSALRESGRGKDLVVVGYELMAPTRAALLDGTMDLVISHPIQKLAENLIATLVRARRAGAEAGTQRTTLPFEMFTPENI